MATDLPFNEDYQIPDVIQDIKDMFEKIPDELYDICWDSIYMHSQDIFIPEEADEIDNRLTLRNLYRAIINELKTKL